ncbi:MAG: hypothetical protein AAB623_00920 [Patescibacteria group bacterium]
MEDTTDLLQIKIEKAKMQLPEETQNAINAVDYKAVILEMRKKKGYSFEQLGDLETETELLLCGLLSPENYPKELGNRMHLSGNEVNELVKEMNNRVFAKIKENLVKRTEEKKEENDDMQILHSAGIEIIPEKKELTTPTPPILAQKLSGYVKNEVVETEHSLENITKISMPTPPITKTSKITIDPYREIPE